MLSWLTGRQSRVAAAFAFAVVLVGGVGLESHRRLLEARERTDWVAHTHEVLAALGAMRAGLEDVESGERGLAITGERRHLRHDEESLARLEQHAEMLRDLVRDSPLQLQRAQELVRLVNARVALMREGLRIYESGGTEAFRRFIQADEGRLTMDPLREAIREMETQERALLSTRATEADAAYRQTRWVLTAGTVTAVAALLFAFAALKRDVRELRRAEQTLQVANESLHARMAEAEQRQREMRLLGELSTFLHASRGPGEVEEVLGRVLPALFPRTSGAVYFFRASRNLLELSARWPGGFEAPRAFAPEDCWALRLGRPHSAERDEPRCAHMVAAAGRPQCLPLMAGGEVTGLLHLMLAGAGAEPQTQLTQAAGAQMALALANLQLRDNLRTQSIRDALTGLFNRRYLEEALASEIARANRANKPIGIVLLDLDHFKRLNDTFGHLAGDAVLKEAGTFLRGRLRAGDIPCRFGGEEFALVLPEADLTVTRKRAEDLREGFAALTLEYHGQALGPLSYSAGVAAYPVHGTTMETLLASADAALYRAKRAGRNRVEVAEAAEMVPEAEPRA